jgi:hypothetical protein
MDFYRVADPESLLTDDVLFASHEQLVWQSYWSETRYTSFGWPRTSSRCPDAMRETRQHRETRSGGTFQCYSTTSAVCSGVVMPGGSSRMRMLRKWISEPSDSRHR